jgi:hypothetical protein
MLNLRVNGEVIKKVAQVNLKRIEDGALFTIASSCVLKLPTGLVHVVGQPEEELDTNIWDVREKFEALEIQSFPAGLS